MNDFVTKQTRRKVRDSLTYLALLLGMLVVAVAVYRGGVHIASLHPDEITLKDLPAALLLSLLRMTTSYVACLIFAFLLGITAARSATGERLILPILDVLQSVPVTGFIPGAISFFIALSSGHRLGVELAACFLIFTSQAWNMAFAVYEAVKTIPQDNLDAIQSFGVRGSSRFWKLYAPASVPRLVYNSILSWSNGWYFLVLCEIITVGQVQYNLPGIGSFLARASQEGQVHLIFWGLLALTLLILTLDFLIWRPAAVWAERFRQDTSSSQQGSVRGRKRTFILEYIPANFVESVQIFFKSLKRLIRALLFPIFFIVRDILMPLFWDLPSALAAAVSRRIYFQLDTLALRFSWIRNTLFWLMGITLGFFSASFMLRWLRPPFPSLAREIPLALLASTARLVVALSLSMAIVLPLILWTWNRPKARQTLTTVAQIGASIPAIALFPLILLIFIKKLGLGMEVASIVLLLSGMLWYVLFNGLGGTANIPPDLGEAVRAMGLKNILTYKRLVLPAIRPALITGALTAWGGGWNALVVSEYVAFQNKTLTVNGIGALLNRAVFEKGDSKAMGLCLVAMVLWVVLINLVLWRPLYRAAAGRYRLEGSS